MGLFILVGFVLLIGVFGGSGGKGDSGRGAGYYSEKPT